MKEMLFKYPQPSLTRQGTLPGPQKTCTPAELFPLPIPPKLLDHEDVQQVLTMHAVLQQQALKIGPTQHTRSKSTTQPAAVVMPQPCTSKGSSFWKGAKIKQHDLDYQNPLEMQQIYLTSPPLELTILAGKSPASKSQGLILMVTTFNK